MLAVDTRRIVPGLLLAASLAGTGCGREPAKQASASADSTRHVRQRLTYLEARRSLGGGELFAAVRHPDPRVRRAQAVALGRIQAPVALEPLLALLADPDSAVVEQATFALGQLQGLDEEQQRMLQTALVKRLDEIPREQAGTLVEALGKQGGPGTVPLLREQLATGVLARFPTRSRPPRVEGLAGIALARIGTDRAKTALADLQTLRIRAPDSAWRLGTALGMLPDPRFVPILTTTFGHPDAYSRAAAARALGKQGDPGVIPNLLDALTDSEWEVRTSLLVALGELGNADTPEAASFCASLAADTHPLVRETALVSLDRIGVGPHEKLVREALEDPVAAVRLAALRALVRSERAAARDDWIRARKDSVDFVRAEALSLGRFVYGDAKAATQLAETLRASTRLERLHAASALGELELASGSARLDARTALEAALEDEDFAVAATAAEALGKLAPREGLPALEAAYAGRTTQRNDVDVRLAVLQAVTPLAKPGSSVASQLLGLFHGAVSDPDPRIADAARAGLAALEGRPEPEKTPVLGPDISVDRDSLPPIDLGLVSVRLVTRHGEAVLELDGDHYPRTVANFLRLVDQGFYDTGVFHRVVPAFVVQGGCPRGDGWGDAGWFLPCEYGDLRYDREGIVGMAHAGKDTGGSQFFITHLPVPRLDGRYTAFGRVVGGMETVDSIVRGDTFSIQRLDKGKKPST